jgi:hypothetical protein
MQRKTKQRTLVSRDMPATIIKIELQFEGAYVDLLYRTEDEDAVDRGERIFMEVFQSARDFVAVFDLPKDGAALGEVLRTGSFCQLKDIFSDVYCAEMPATERVYQTHDGILGILEKPDEWMTAQLPDDWPSENFDDEGDPFWSTAGLAATGPMVVRASVHFADGSNTVWQPPTPVSATELANHWPELQGCAC